MTDVCPETTSRGGANVLLDKQLIIRLLFTMIHHLNTLLTDWDAAGWLYLVYAAAVRSEWQRRVGRVQW